MTEFAKDLFKVMNIKIIEHEGLYIVFKNGKFHALGNEFEDLLSAKLYISNSRIALANSIWVED